MNAPLQPSVLRIDMDFVRAAARGQLALPSVPRVVRHLIAELKTREPHVPSLVAELEQEPQLAARTLRIANSPYYAGRRTLASLSDAVVVIGTDTLRTLVISCGVEAVFVQVPGVNLRQFWLDANVTARAARSLARLGGHDAEAAFLAGLLHSVGHLILCQAFPGPTQARFGGARVLRGAELAEAEADICGLSFPDVGAAWLDELGFPEPIVHAVALQLDAAWAPRGSLAAVLALATQVCASIDVHDSAAQALSKLDAGLLAAASLAGALNGGAFSASYHQIAGGAP